MKTKPDASPLLFEQYVDSMPSDQNAIDAVPGWNTVIPVEGVTAGTLPLYADDRIAWCFGELGGVSGMNVLELGPLEGSHTYMLENGGAASIDAIEANRLAFLRCLVFKELVGLQRARFRLGNFVTWLERTETRYDLVLASGVLYHQPDPLGLLELIGRASDAVYLWTHYASEEHMPPSDPRRLVFRKGSEVRSFHGVDVKLYRRSYNQAATSATFCGGLYDDHRWIDRDDLLAALRALGFSRLSVAHEQPNHPFGPSFSVLARR